MSRNRLVVWLIDGTNIPNSGDYVIFDNTKLDKVICDGVVVWEKQKDITMTPTNYGGLSVTEMSRNRLVVW